MILREINWKLIFFHPSNILLEETENSNLLEIYQNLFKKRVRIYPTSQPLVKRCTTGLNSMFSFSQISYHTEAK